MAVKAYLKESALSFLEDRPRYFEDKDGNRIKEREGISRASFYNGINGQGIRWETAMAIGKILGVDPEEWSRHIEWRRDEKTEISAPASMSTPVESLTAH